MKQISIALNVIFFAIFLYSFSKSDKTLNHSDDKPLPLYSSCTTCDGPFEGIPAKEFVEDIERYKTTHWNLVNKDAFTKGIWNKTFSTKSKLYRSFEDSRCIWFSLDTIKKFICHIEQYSKELNIPKDSLGMRIYYAVYNTASNGHRESQHTLFMVPTTQVDNEAEDFDPYFNFNYRNLPNVNEGNLPKASLINLPLFLDSCFIAESKTFNLNQPIMMLGITNQSNPDPNYFARNNGNLCPTNCPKVNTLTEIDNNTHQPVDYK